MRYDVAVLGAGAAGLMCAIEAGRRGRRVVVLERNEAPGKKILISGGGRCNFTNTGAGPANYYSQNPDFCRSALAGFPPARFIEMVEHHGIAYHEKKLGQLFCDGSAAQIVAMLLRECDAAGVDLRLNCEIRSVAKPDAFTVDTSVGAFEAESLVVSTGGLSIPQLGASGLGYRIARRFGLNRVETRPGLVPLTFDPDAQRFFSSLSGTSFEATVSCGICSFTENVLFTHRGLSGPAVLQISNCWREGSEIRLDLLPHVEVRDLLADASRNPRELASVLSGHLPRRFAQAWCDAFARSRPMNRYTSKELDAIAGTLGGWGLHPAATGGYGKAEVTLGGVDTRELQSKTMESRKVPGLYFVGEVVDVTGWLGGYNFQWAWASGYAAGQYA